MKQQHIDKITEFLKKHSSKLKSYQWKTETYTYDGLEEFLPATDIAEINNQKNRFHKEEKFKDIVSVALQKLYKNNNAKFEQLCLWIIRNWGGIRGGTDENTLKVVNDFLKNKDDNPGFNRISSASKIAGLMCPDQHIIYDSRVAFTMNWIILSQDIPVKYFPIPEGKNTWMNAFDIDVLIRLKYKEHYFKGFNQDKREKISKLDDTYYFKDKDAYTKMREVITQVNAQMWEDDKRKQQLFYTQMLLFILADTVVMNDILK